MRKNNNKKGFTIVELVIVIAVIAILAAVLIPTFSGVIDKAKESGALQKATSLYKDAYAVAISDGEIKTDETKEETVISGNLAFKFTSADGSIDIETVVVYATTTKTETDGSKTTIADTGNPGKIDGYTVTVVDGVVKVKK